MPQTARPLRPAASQPTGTSAQSGGSVRAPKPMTNHETALPTFRCSRITPAC